jgi:hypothetical protein
MGTADLHDDGNQMECGEFILPRVDGRSQRRRVQLERLISITIGKSHFSSREPPGAAMKRLLVCLLLAGVVGCEAENTPKTSSVAAKSTIKLTTCPDCEGEVSKRAATCPHCGAPLKLTNSTTRAVDDPDVPERERQTLDEFGRRVFKAIQNLNATELQYCHLQFSDIELLKERLQQLVADPRKKSLVAQLPMFQQYPSEEDFSDFQKEMSDEVFEFIKDIKDEDSNISPAKLADSTYLGIVMSKIDGDEGDDPLAQMVQELGVEVSEAGVGMYDNPTLFFESDGNVFVVRLNEGLFKLNHVWCVTGDMGFRQPFPIEPGTNLENLDYHPDTKAVIEKVNRVLRQR